MWQFWRIDEMSPAKIEDANDFLERLPERENSCPMVMKTFSLVSTSEISSTTNVSHWKTPRRQLDSTFRRRKHVPTGPPTTCGKTKSITLQWIPLSFTMSMLGTLLTGWSKFTFQEKQLFFLSFTMFSSISATQTAPNETALPTFSSSDSSSCFLSSCP